MSDLPTRYESSCLRSFEDLDEHYGDPVPASLVKEIDHIFDHYRAFIEKSPFTVLASVGPEGLDCSPRGDAPGFVRVLALLLRFTYTYNRLQRGSNSSLNLGRNQLV